MTSGWNAWRAAEMTADRSCPAQRAAAARRDADRKFYAWLFVISGAAAQAGGWVAAFTDVGAVLVIGGPLLSLAGWAIRPTRWTFFAAIAGIALCGWGWMAIFFAL